MSLTLVEKAYREFAKVNKFRWNGKGGDRHSDINRDIILNYFTVWLRNRVTSAGFEPVLSNAEKSCIASYYRQFSMNKLSYPVRTYGLSYLEKNFINDKCIHHTCIKGIILSH